MSCCKPPCVPMPTYLIKNHPLCAREKSGQTLNCCRWNAKPDVHGENVHLPLAFESISRHESASLEGPSERQKVTHHFQLRHWPTQCPFLAVDERVWKEKGKREITEMYFIPMHSICPQPHNTIFHWMMLKWPYSVTTYYLWCVEEFLWTVQL